VQANIQEIPLPKPKLLASAAATALAFCAVPYLGAQVRLIAKGTLTGSAAGPYADLSGLKDTLEDGAPANLLGGLGSGIAHVSGDTFVAVPDRGPNAVPYNVALDDTTSYIDRVQTIRMKLQHKEDGALPFTLTPELERTTLLSSFTLLAYGSGLGVGAPSGRPASNHFLRNYFTGRSDGYSMDHGSGDPNDARFDPESIRVSPDRLTYFISDEYGPYVYEFLSSTGTRLRSYKLPSKYYVADPRSTGGDESLQNTQGRVPNKGMEGLAITPDGRTLVGIMQNSLLQDAAEGGDAAKLLRIIAIDVISGRIKGEYAYLLSTGTGVSEIVAVNDHEFLVDERDGKGLGDGSKAKVKQLFKISLQGAFDVSSLSATQAAAHAVGKTLFADLVKIFAASGISADQVPAKIEGIAFGEDVQEKNTRLHTLYVANDNDFLQDYGGPGSNPNQLFVLGFTDADLNGSVYRPERTY
jgi:hypothetical protein